MKKSIELADVNIRYIDMKNNTEEKLNAKIAATTTRSRDVYETSKTRLSMPMWSSRSRSKITKRRLALRDKGKVNEAKRILFSIRRICVPMQATEVKNWIIRPRKCKQDADAVEEDDWNVQRKFMRESQSVRKTQR